MFLYLYIPSEKLIDIFFILALMLSQEFIYWKRYYSGLLCLRTNPFNLQPFSKAKGLIVQSTTVRERLWSIRNLFMAYLGAISSIWPCNGHWKKSTSHRKHSAGQWWTKRFIKSCNMTQKLLHQRSNDIHLVTAFYADHKY